MDSVVHFEIPYDDRNRIARFYQTAFDWQIQMLGEEMDNYILATTVETDDTGPTRPGAINGGLYARRPEMPDAKTGLVVAVQDIRASMEKVVAAGGRVFGEPVEIHGVGLYVPFLDTEGNRLSMLQPVPMNGAGPA